MILAGIINVTAPTQNASIPIPSTPPLNPGMSPGGSLRLSHFTTGANRIVAHNESGYTIGLLLPDGSTANLASQDRRLFCTDKWPHGTIVWWQEYAVAGAATLIPYIFFELYLPGEPVLEVYPSTLPRQVAASVSTVQTLSNEGGVAGQLVVDIGDANFSQLIAIYNNGKAVWSVDQGGIKHQVFNIQTSGVPLQLGQAGDITEILGSAQIDQIPNTSVNGSVSGTLTLYEWVVGPFKLVIIDENNYNAGAVANLTLPTAFTHGALIWTGGIGTSGNGNLSLTSGGTQQNMNIITGLAAAGGSISASNTNLFQYSFAECITGFNVVQFGATGAVAHTSRSYILGI